MSNRKNGDLVMKTIENPKRDTWSLILKRPTQTVEDIENTVIQIFQDIQQNGDFAVSKYTSIFDGVELDDIIVSDYEITEASRLISEDLKTAIKNAKQKVLLQEPRRAGVSWFCCLR